MNTEEKAKAHDEALERAKDCLTDRKFSETEDTIRSVVEYIFPELAESKDERIRKAIIGLIEELQRSDKNFAGVELTDMIAYLEKQKEHLPIPDKFSGLKSLMLQYLQSAANRKDDTKIESDTDLWGRKILDYVWKYSDEQKEQKSVESHKRNKPKESWLSNAKYEIEHADELLIQTQEELREIRELKNQEQKPENELEDAFKYYTDRGISISCGDIKAEPNKEQKPRKFKLGDKVHWHDDDTIVMTITGFRDDAYLTDSAYGPILFCNEDNWEKVEQKPAEKQDYSGLNDLERAILRGFLSAGVDNVPVTIIKETAKECLAQIKTAEWSEKDEKMLTELLLTIEPSDNYDEMRNWLLLKLKSLLLQGSKDSLQTHWKPSEEQKEALEYVIRDYREDCCNATANYLQEVLDHLKNM